VSTIPRISGRAAVAAFRKLEYEVDRQRGSHIILRHSEPPHRRLALGLAHLHRYVDEFSFQYNTRKMDDGERTLAAIRASDGRALTIERYRNA
jgi:hypothetical protein